MLVAGDTFRAAAIDQLKIWGERTGASVMAREPGADAAGLAFDALAAAKTQGTDVVLVDTAGRLQNRTELMGELEKIVRVMRKVEPAAPHAVLLVLDATVGQNALSQVEIFGKIAGVTGLVMTKLDGTARGGILVAIAAQIRPAGAFHRRRRGRRRSRRRSPRGISPAPVVGMEFLKCETSHGRKETTQSHPQARARHRAAGAVLRRQCEVRHLRRDRPRSWWRC